ncbi:uncharacterized protein ATC70_008319 [Mucor velutinosus]|uniref:Uncharacterized protein n=1 Tax=Mucor velutinosus TaxID=708070 RepID=A0AAN7DN38_9FUNG|nr:hypothetical protein ATC70_008319 [Mucor velutinosus]
MTFPFLTNTSCALAAGIYAIRGNDEMASKLTMAQYYFWTFYCGYLGTLLLFAGVRLMRLLDKHLLVQSELRVNIQKVKTGALKVRIIVVVGTSCMWIFAFLLGLYSACREAVMMNQATNMVVAAVWLFAGPIATFFVEIAVLINPEIAAQLGHLSFGSSSDSRMSHEQLGCNSRKLTSFELGLSSKVKSTQSNFIISKCQLDEDARFSFNIIKRPEDSKDVLLLDEKDSITTSNDSSKLTKVEQEQQKYNATIGRVRTPPPFRAAASSSTNSNTLF